MSSHSLTRLSSQTYTRTRAMRAQNAPAPGEVLEQEVDASGVIHEVIIDDAGLPAVDDGRKLINIVLEVAEQAKHNAQRSAAGYGNSFDEMDEEVSRAAVYYMFPYQK